MIYEYRSYEAAPERLDDLDRRFKTLTWPVMVRLGFQQVGFWVPEGGNSLTYLLKWKDKADAEAKWKSFQQDPEWREGRAASEANGKIVVSTTSTFLKPTSYSEAQ